jgi:hypothetical protein
MRTAADGMDSEVRLQLDRFIAAECGMNPEVRLT